MKLLAAILCLVLTVRVALAATQEEEARLLKAVQDACVKQDVGKLVAVIGNYQAVEVNVLTVSNLFHSGQVESVQYEPFFRSELEDAINETYRVLLSPSFGNGGIKFSVTPNPAITHCLRISLKKPTHWMLVGISDPFVFRIYFSEENGHLRPASNLAIVHPESQSRSNFPLVSHLHSVNWHQPKVVAEPSHEYQGASLTQSACPVNTITSYQRP